MKKIYRILAFLAISISFGIAPIKAMEERGWLKRITSSLPLKKAGPNFSTLAKVKEFFPVGTTIATKDTPREEYFQGTVIDYGEESQMVGGVTLYWPTLKIKTSGSEEIKMLNPAHVKLLALPRSEE